MRIYDRLVLPHCFLLHTVFSLTGHFAEAKVNGPPSELLEPHPGRADCFPQPMQDTPVQDVKFPECEKFCAPPPSLQHSRDKAVLESEAVPACGVSLSHDRCFLSSREELNEVSVLPRKLSTS